MTKGGDFLSDFVQQAYFYELQRRDQLSNKTQAILILISLIFAALAASIDNAITLFLRNQGLSLILLCLAAVCVFWASGILVRLQLFSKNYNHVASPKKFRDFYEACRAHAADPEAIKAKIDDQLIQVAEHNLTLNDDRAMKIRTTEHLIFYAVGFCIIEFIVRMASSLA